MDQLPGQTVFVIQINAFKVNSVTHIAETEGHNGADKLHLN